jgi:hypothetical protein
MESAHQEKAPTNMILKDMLPSTIEMNFSNGFIKALRAIK